VNLDLEALQNPSPYAAQNAALMFIDADRDTAVARCLPFLSHPDAVVRKVVAGALAYRPYDHLMLGQDKLPLIAPGDVDPLIALMQSTDASVRSCVAVMLGDVRDACVIPALLSGLRDSCAYVRSNAAEALTRREGAEVGDALIHALKHDPVAEVRRATLFAVQMTNPCQAFEAVAHMLGNDSDSKNRSYAVSTLGELDPARASTLVAQALRTEADWIERGHMIIQLYHMSKKAPWDASVEPLLQELRDNDPNEFVRKDAGNVLTWVEWRRSKKPGFGD